MYKAKLNRMERLEEQSEGRTSIPPTNEFAGILEVVQMEKGYVKKTLYESLLNQGFAEVNIQGIIEKYYSRISK